MTTKQLLEQVLATLPGPCSWETAQFCMQRGEELRYDESAEAQRARIIYNDIAYDMTLRLLSKESLDYDDEVKERLEIRLASLHARGADVYHRTSQFFERWQTFMDKVQLLRGQVIAGFAIAERLALVSLQSEQPAPNSVAVPPPSAPPANFDPFPRPTFTPPAATTVFAGNEPPKPYALAAREKHNGGTREWQQWHERYDSTGNPYFERKDVKELKGLSRFVIDHKMKWPTHREKDTDTGFPIFPANLKPYLLYDPMGRPFPSQEHLYMTYDTRLEKDPMQFKQYMEDHGIYIKCDNCYNERLTCNHDWECHQCSKAKRACTYTWTGIEGKDVYCRYGRRCEQVHTWAAMFFKFRADIFNDYADFSVNRVNVDPCKDQAASTALWRAIFDACAPLSTSVEHPPAASAHAQGPAVTPNQKSYEKTDKKPPVVKSAGHPAPSSGNLTATSNKPMPAKRVHRHFDLD